MTRQDPDDADDAMELTVSPLAQRAASIIEDGITSGRMSDADVAYFTDAFKRAGIQVAIPTRRGGVIVTKRKRCGRTNCRCAAKGALGHGPYVFRRYRDKWGKQKEEYLGRLTTPDKAPRRLSRPAPDLPASSAQLPGAWLAD